MEHIFGSPTRDFYAALRGLRIDPILCSERLGLGSNNAQTVKAGVNLVQFIFLIATIRLSNMWGAIISVAMARVTERFLSSSTGPALHTVSCAVQRADLRGSLLP